jgi:hypothetical protein
VRDDVHGDGLQLIFHVAEREDDELLIDVDVGWFVDEAGPSALGVLGESLGKDSLPPCQRALARSRS